MNAETFQTCVEAGKKLIKKPANLPDKRNQVGGSHYNAYTRSRERTRTVVGEFGLVPSKR